MATSSQPYCVAATLLANLLAMGAIGMLAPALSWAAESEPSQRIQPSSKPHLDLSGRTRIGIASFYADRFAGRKMANGVRMNPAGTNAASRTLPLGTVARVTNLETRRSAIVTIQDRGPYVKGRIVDLSPSTARRIGLTPRIGLAKVRVTPLTIPLPDGRMLIARASARAVLNPPPSLQ